MIRSFGSASAAFVLALLLIGQATLPSASDRFEDASVEYPAGLPKPACDSVPGEPDFDACRRFRGSMTAALGAVPDEPNSTLRPERSRVVPERSRFHDRRPPRRGDSRDGSETH